jgi:acetyltransferase-like isoleucine patch superfamily enzyme
MISERDRIAFDETIGYTKDNKFVYGLKFFKNWVLERLASNFPIPSWRVALHRMRGVNIGKNVYIGYDVIFDRIHPDCVTIGDYAEIGDRCIISAHSRGSLPLRERYPRSVQPVTIGSGVWMAPWLHRDPGRGDRGELGHRDGCCRDEEHPGELSGCRGAGEGCKKA